MLEEASVPEGRSQTRQGLRPAKTAGQIPRATESHVKSSIKGRGRAGAAGAQETCCYVAEHHVSSRFPGDRRSLVLEPGKETEGDWITEGENETPIPTCEFFSCHILLRCHVSLLCGSSLSCPGHTAGPWASWDTFVL